MWNPNIPPGGAKAYLHLRRLFCVPAQYLSPETVKPWDVFQNDSENLIVERPGFVTSRAYIQEWDPCSSSVFLVLICVSVPHPKLASEGQKLATVHNIYLDPGQALGGGIDFGETTPFPPSPCSHNSSRRGRGSRVRLRLLFQRATPYWKGRGYG